MKSFLGTLLAFSTFVAVLGGGAILYYLSCTAEFSRKVAGAEVAPKASVVAPKEVPKARPVR